MRSIAFALALLALSCVPKSGRLESNRFQHDRYPYAIFYETPGHPDAPFGSSWRVDNYAESTDRRHVPKQESGYIIERTYDLNGDGRGDFERAEQLYDLLLVHRSKNARMWVRTLPLSAQASEEALSVLAKRYADTMAASGEIAPPFGPEATNAARPGAATLREERSCAISKREAERVEVTLPGAPEKRASFVLVRSGYYERVFDGASGAGKYAVLLVLGAEAPAADFDSVVPDFERLLDHTVLGDVGLGLSMNAENTCGPAGAGAGGEAP